MPKHSVGTALRKVGLYPSARKLYWYLTQFQHELDFYSELIQPGSLCFDIGANIGEKTEVFLKSGAKVVAFEPQSDCIKQLEARCKSYSNSLAICQSVLGAESGEAKFYVHSVSAHSSLNAEWEENSSSVVSTISVPMMTLDQAIDRFGKPIYCKIDVEGWELNLFKGLTQPIPLVSFEYHLGERDVENTLACLHYLDQFGELSLNITTAKSLKFEFNTWMSLQEFLAVFPEQFQSQSSFYGDIFVRTN